MSRGYRRRRDHQGAALVVGALLVIGLVLMILKWLLITAAILAVPFGLWWLVDREKRRSEEPGVP